MKDRAYVSETVDSRVVRCRMGSKRLEQATAAELTWPATWYFNFFDLTSQMHDSLNVSTTIKKYTDL